MGNNRGYKGSIDYRNNPTIGRSGTTNRYQDRRNGGIETFSGNNLQEYTAKASDWIRMAVSASDHPTSGSILYGWPGDTTHGWYTSGECKMRLKRNLWTRDTAEYTEISWRVPNKSNTFMVGIRPKISALGFKYNTTYYTSFYGNITWGVYFAGATAQSYYNGSGGASYTWNAGDKFAIRFYKDGSVKYCLNDVIQFTQLTTTQVCSNTTYYSPYWGNGQEFSFWYVLNSLPTDKFLYDLRFKGPTVLKETPFDELFTLPTSSMQMTNLSTGVLTGTGADGLPFISASTVSAWAAGGMSTQTFTGSFGGDVCYSTIPYQYSSETVMHFGACEQDETIGASWYNDDNVRGMAYTAGTGKFPSTYKQALVTNGGYSLQCHASASVRFARVISNEMNAGWKTTADSNTLATFLFYNPGDTQQYAGGGWVPVAYNIGSAYGNSITTPVRACSLFSSNDGSQLGGLSFATSSRS